MVWRQTPALGLLVIPGLLQELLVAISFLLRGRPRQAAGGWAPRLVSYANTFLVMIFLWFAAGRHASWVRPTPVPVLRTIGASLWLCGAVLSLWPLWYLRRSFSVEPEARSLVTSGPYRFARHPIYAVYLLLNIGILFGHLTVPFAAVFAAWAALLLIRIRYEEAVLTSAFREYPAYRAQVGAFGPRLGASSAVRAAR